MTLGKWEPLQMDSFADRIVNAYAQKAYVYPTTKTTVLDKLEGLKGEVASLDEFGGFPEGASGILLYALLKKSAKECPDLGDFNYIYQGLQAVLDACFEDIAKNTHWLTV
jgi:hypothetical protein